jgi:hypothetical protein
VQAVKGTVIVTKTLCPGPRTPLEGRKTMPPGTFVKANQCRLLWALGLDSTRAKQTKAPFFDNQDARQYSLTMVANPGSQAPLAQ